MSKSGLISIAIFAFIISLAGLGIWYTTNRPAFLTIVCEAGLGNFTRPTSLDRDSVRCAILEPKRTYRGILITGFEASNFMSDDFEPVKDWKNDNQTSSWFNCPKSGCGAALEKELSVYVVNDCPRFNLHAAYIEAEGWVTLKVGNGYGHLNNFPREFWAAKIIKVQPVPKKFIEEWFGAVKRHGLCDPIA